MSINVISPATNYTVNNSPGWSTRLVYSYFGTSGEYFDYVSRMNNFDDDLFTILYNDATDNQKGGLYSQTWNYDGSYLTTSKTFRIKGRFLISSQGAAIFNMSVQSYHNPTTTVLASTNGGNSHLFADGAAGNTVPVDFEITITALQNLIVLGTNTQYFMVNGFYQYNFDDYSGDTSNRSNAYVPIYNTAGPYTQCGDITASQEFQITFHNSSKINAIEVAYITIEEFS